MKKRHYPRFDTTVCPNPDHCVHTTEFPGESCECCGHVIPNPDSTAIAAAAHAITGMTAGWTDEHGRQPFPINPERAHAIAERAVRAALSKMAAQ